MSWPGWPNNGALPTPNCLSFIKYIYIYHNFKTWLGLSQLSPMCERTPPALMRLKFCEFVSELDTTYDVFFWGASSHQQKQKHPYTVH